jgi:hypothetical protein
MLVPWPQTCFAVSTNLRIRDEAEDAPTSHVKHETLSEIVAIIVSGARTASSYRVRRLGSKRIYIDKHLRIATFTDNTDTNEVHCS